MTTDLKTWAGVAEGAARAAGGRLRARAGDWAKINAEERKDVKLQADVESEQLIRAQLAKAAGFPVIGEEKGGDAGLTARYEPYWIVDPLDGTHNYLRGVPLCCVSIALFRGETPLLGVIYDFNHDELFSGVVADGFYINGQRHESRWAEELGKASLQTGFPAGRDFSEESLALFIRKVQRFKKIRQIGTAALAVAWVAAGRYDAYFEEGIKLWDIAAGLALVQAAGGVIRMTPSPTAPLAYDVWAAGRPEFIADAPK